jgi:hypothetical protein
MNTETKNKLISDLLKLAKEQFGDFSDTQKQEIFLTVKEAKVRGLLRQQPRDRCLSDYVNKANHLLRVQSTEEFSVLLNQSLDYIYVYVALIGTKSITFPA